MSPFTPFKDAALALEVARAICRITTRPWNIMEICGGQTHALAKYGIEEMLPREITLIHGPGCPVCVTPSEKIDQAIDLSLMPHVILATFGDMVRVPGNRISLQQAKSKGGNIQIVYSPLDTLTLAKQNPDKEIVFFAIGFETTTPLHALTILEAQRQQINNLSFLTSLFSVPAAIEALIGEPENQIDGILGAGHVCAITGYEDYLQIALTYKRPIVITGFEPLDLLYGIYRCVKQLEDSSYRVENAYSRIVKPMGNPRAKIAINRVFAPCHQSWRGLDTIKNSGFDIRISYKQYDTVKRFLLETQGKSSGPNECCSGDIMKGKLQPQQCRHFATNCTPEHPLGAPMVSTEGACAAYFKYHLNKIKYEIDNMSYFAS